MEWFKSKEEKKKAIKHGEKRKNEEEKENDKLEL